MITITELEFILFVGFVVMCFLYFKTKSELYTHRRMTGEVFMRIAKGKLKVTETEDGFDLISVSE